MSEIKKEIVEFLKNALTNKNISIKDFEMIEDNIDNESKDIWKFLVLKSFEKDFNYLLPISYYIIDNNYCEISKDVIKFAALYAYQKEQVDEVYNKFETEMNNNLKLFSDDLNIKIENKDKTIDDLYYLTKKIIKEANPEDLQEVLEVFKSGSIDLENAKFMKKAVQKKGLKL